MTGWYGRASSHQRVVDYTPDIRIERTTVLSSIRASGEMVPLIFEGALDGEMFGKYVAQCLAPSLQPGDIVIMDNLSSHKVEGVIDPIIAAGATSLFTSVQPWFESNWVDVVKNKGLPAKTESKN